MRMPTTALAVSALVAVALLEAGCGEGDDKQRAVPPAERADPPATPPRGWRTVRNSTAGFTIAAPRAWRARTTKGRTVIQSEDRLVAMSISSDRTMPGRTLSAPEYARRTLRTLPGFVGIAGKEVRRVPGSPYDSALLTATGTVKPSNLSQRISVAILRRSGRVTYGILVFRNAGVKPGFNDATINRMLRSFRAQPPG